MGKALKEISDFEISDHDIDQIFSKIDSNNSGKINFLLFKSNIK